MELKVIKTSGTPLVIASKSKHQTNHILNLYNMKVAKNKTKQFSTIGLILLTILFASYTVVLGGHFVNMLITFFK